MASNFDINRFKSKEKSSGSSWDDARNKMTELLDEARQGYADKGNAAWGEFNEDKKKMEEDIAMQELNQGTGWGADVATGIGVGSAWGPIGALVGAGVGALKGGIQSHFAQQDYAKKTGKGLTGKQTEDLFWRGAGATSGSNGGANALTGLARMKPPGGGRMGMDPDASPQLGGSSGAQDMLNAYRSEEPDASGMMPPSLGSGPKMSGPSMSATPGMAGIGLPDALPSPEVPTDFSIAPLGGDPGALPFNRYKTRHQ
jgi:hypothetical protein